MKRISPIFLLFVFLFSFSGLHAQKSKAKNDSLVRLDSVRTYMLQASLLAMNAMQSKMDAERTNDKFGSVNAQKAGESQNLFVQSRYYYRKALSFDSTYYSAWSNLGTTYYFDGLIKASVPYFRKSVRLKDDYAQGWYNLGKAYDKLGKKDSAFYSLKKCIASDSTYVPGYVELSRLYLLENDSSAALHLLRTGIRIKPEVEVLYTSMTAVYFQEKDTLHAVAVMEKAATINPDNIAQLDFLSAWFSRNNDPAKAGLYAKMAAAARKRQEIPEEKGE